MRHITTSFLLISVSLLFTGCGGGGSASLRPSDFETPEYERQAGLRLINASSVYARGGTGKGVTVGVFDSGANPSHPALAGKYRLISGWRGDSDTEDDGGHGSHVAGIIAARKNGSEMHGVAYEAELASYKINYDSDTFWQDYANGINYLRSNDVLIVNHSWGSKFTSILDLSSEDIDDQSNAIRAAKDYADADGVQVWITHNHEWDQPTWQAGLPYLIPELEDGWLAVTAVGNNGELASYANKCGVAAAWCIAAPGGDFDTGGGIYSTVLDGMYEEYHGTSMAAPHVSGALAVLKSMFPNLSYQDVRDRVLYTADKSGIYADTLIFGQGLLDLDTASKPVGGTNFALGAYDAGKVVTTAGARIALPSAALARYFEGRTMIVLDSFQRAPFEVPVDAFAGSAGGYLSMDDLGLRKPERTWQVEDEDTVALAIAGTDFQARGVSDGAYFMGSGHGSRVTEGLAHLVGVSLPHGRFRMAEDALGVTLGFSSGAGEIYASAAAGGETEKLGDTGYGIVGWSPRTVMSASFVPSGSGEVIGASLASGLSRPMGFEGAGAFELTGNSVELAYSHNLVSHNAFRLDVAGRLAHLATAASPLVRIGDAVLAATELDLSMRLMPKVTFNARLGVERSVASSTGSIRVASSIDEDGRLTYDDIAIDGSELLEFDSISVAVSYAHGPGTQFGAGVMAVRDGFGEIDGIAGARAELRF